MRFFLLRRARADGTKRSAKDKNAHICQDETGCCGDTAACLIVRRSAGTKSLSAGQQRTFLTAWEDAARNQLITNQCAEWSTAFRNRLT